MPRYQWSDALRRRILQRLRDGCSVSKYVAAIKAEDVNTIGWRHDLALFVEWLMTTGEHHTARALVCSMAYEWHEAHTAADACRNAISGLTSWSPAGHQDRQWIDSDAINPIRSDDTE